MKFQVSPARPQPVSALLQSVTDIRQDLADFDRRFGLPPARIQVIRALAGSSASPWLAGAEEVEDTELVHAVAPDATIREILVGPAEVSTPAKFAATFAAYVRVAVHHGEVISQSGIGQDFSVGEGSWTRAEVATMNSALEYAAARHVTVVAASGDAGQAGHPARFRSARARGGRHQPDREPRHRRVHQRDGLEHPRAAPAARRFGWRIQPRRSSRRDHRARLEEVAAL